MIESLQVVKVGIADMKIVRAPGLIRTSGLGSCVGVVIYDQVKEIAGLAHVMLPDSTLAKAGTINRAKYADTAIKELVSLLVKGGASPLALKAKIAGGAQMFQFAAANDMMRIGPRNVEAVKRELAELKIVIVAEDVGGNNGRTIEFNPKTCELTIRTVNKGTGTI
ncbi:CheD [Bacillus methanolicus PB1]|uniref:Chemoreceptor glutamine deamidase CheD n=1 Tax=Bacillus methanolicus PB1 TaxID=997296 RepID=I3E4Q5_BACMT|nr:chemotaxis protein CheD [Bacillus methanolicus]EIJ81476.1 CheD [Bacillus methanolicus PB1]